MSNQITQLEEQIINRIHRSPNNRISFYEFMNMALYEQELGYYSRDKSKIGKNADFYTSTSVGAVFGQTIANSFIELFQPLADNRFMLLEMGGGDGRLALDILNQLKNNHPNMYQNLTYYMLEVSPYHRDLQQYILREHLEQLIWINKLEELPKPFLGIIFSNELLDAFPVHKVKMSNGKLMEIYVTYDDNKLQFVEEVAETSNNRLKDYFDMQGVILNEGQVAEINLAAIDWLHNLNRVLEKGYILTIDYGYPAEELYASHRHEGTLMCYHRHIANDNPYQNIGEQDITSHVNFSILEVESKRLGIEKVWFTTQSHYLINNGILNSLRDVDSLSLTGSDFINNQALKVNRAIRQLITPGEMGETFKVLLLQKNIEKQDYSFLKEVWERFEK